MNAEAAGQLVQVLEKTISPDQTELKAAQLFLESAAQTNLPELIKTLSDVLYQGGNSAVVRQQAGVQLKNFLHTNDESLRTQYEERWLAMPEEIRNYTKVSLGRICSPVLKMKRGPLRYRTTVSERYQYRLAKLF
jgi:importin subunit beta-1